MAKPHRTKPVEIRYNRALSHMRSLRVGGETKDIQEDLMWTKRQIEDYGFTFFSNHFCYPLVMRFEKLVEELAQHPSTKVGK